MWISFLPGVGTDNDPPPPTIENVEEHMNSSPGSFDHNEPIVCVAFSISASEPRMMVLRNMVGKMMAWCKEHKLFLKEKPWNRRDDDENDYETPIDKVHFVDIIQDEGNRVGCYALWDAFSDLINGTDLKFVEELASEMRDMAAADKILKSNKM